MIQRLFVQCFVCTNTLRDVPYAHSTHAFALVFLTNMHDSIYTNCDAQPTLVPFGQLDPTGQGFNIISHSS